MFSGYWLLADLDGTLISTPHKAQGRYLPITESPCFKPICDWLLEGGNVCVVTTADQRVIEQVYVPLRATLAAVEQKFGTSAMTSADYPSLTDFHSHGKRGCLLLSLYTGAVLYHCTARTVATVPEYANSLHCATQEAIKLAVQFHVRERMLQAPVLVMPPKTVPTATPQGESTAMPPPAPQTLHAPTVRDECCVRGTCFDREVCGRLKRRTRTLYEALFNDVVAGKDSAVLEGMCDMSQRYKNMWMALLRFVDVLYTDCISSMGTAQYTGERAERGADTLGKFLAGLNATTRMSRKAFREFLESRAAHQSKEEIAWKVQYFHSRRGVLTALGILRVEYVEKEVSYGADGGARAQSPEAAQQQAKTAEAAVVTRAVEVLLSDLPYAQGDDEVRALAKCFSTYMTQLLGTDPRYLAKEAEQPTGAEELAGVSDIAQVILLGVPLRLFSHYFKSYIPTIIRAGLQAMPQPNSAVFSKLGISKSTTLRYLLGKDRVLAQDASLSEASVAALNGPSAHGSSQFACSVDPAHALALGDNPHTTDFELTVFPDVRFVSVEKFEQRSERHARIHRRLTRATQLEERHEQGFLPDGSPAPSLEQLRASTLSSGAMMDDRLRRNLLHLGGEEDGTAMLLGDLITCATVSPSNPAGDGAPRTMPAATFAAAVPTIVSKRRRELLSRVRVASKL